MIWQALFPTLFRGGEREYESDFVGLFNDLQRWQRRRKAKSLLEAGNVDAARDAIGTDSALRQELAEALLDAGRLDLGQALLGHTGGSTLEALLQQVPADPELDRLLAEARGRELPSNTRVLELARTFLERGQKEPALALLERAGQSTRNWELIRAGIEASLDAKQWERAWHLVEAGLGALKALRGTPEHEFLLGAHRRALSELEGVEAVTIDLLMRGELDLFATNNHVLLAKALMREGPALASRLTLVSAPQELREGEDRIRTERKNASGLMQVGSARLRLGELEEAADAFTRGRDTAPRHFALVAGLGAARALIAQDAIARVRALPDISVVEGLALLLPDLEQLTTLELRVVQASVRPLAQWLPKVDGRLRILPLDVRVTDLPEFKEVELGALHGLAGDGLGCVRVETLFDTTTWPLAHELAHLVFPALPEKLKAQLREGASESFALTYARWLGHRYAIAPTVADFAPLEGIVS